MKPLSLLFLLAAVPAAAGVTIRQQVVVAAGVAVNISPVMSQCRLTLLSRLAAAVQGVLKTRMVRLEAILHLEGS
jgi:hypothetical protein